MITILDNGRIACPVKMRKKHDARLRTESILLGLE